MSDTKQAVIISAARTPTGKFQGALKGFSAPDLGAIVIKEAVNRAGVDPAVVSAPLISTLVDGTGLIIYFEIARLVLSP